MCPGSLCHGFFFTKVTLRTAEAPTIEEGHGQPCRQADTSEMTHEFQVKIGVGRRRLMEHELRLRSGRAAGSTSAGARRGQSWGTPVEASRGLPPVEEGAEGGAGGGARPGVGPIPRTPLGPAPPRRGPRRGRRAGLLCRVPLGLRAPGAATEEPEGGARPGGPAPGCGWAGGEGRAGRGPF